MIGQLLLKQGLVVMPDGADMSKDWVAPIHSMFDLHGELTDDPAACHTFTCGYENDWHRGIVATFEQPVIH
jgi:hypothetical protein